MLAEKKLTEKEFAAQYRPFLGGGAIHKDHLQDWKDLCRDQERRLHDKMNKNKRFAESAFYYELSNYECFISYRYDEALGALGLTAEEVNANPRFLDAYVKARRKCYNWGLENM